jgi:hypothetical protein
MFVSEDVDGYDCAFLNFVHAGVFVDEAWTHQIGSLHHEFECTFVGGEAGVHGGVGMYGLHYGDAVVADKDEMGLFIDYDVFTTMVFAGLQLVAYHFCLFWKEDFDLCFGE